MQLALQSSNVSGGLICSPTSTGSFALVIIVNYVKLAKFSFPLLSRLPPHSSLKSTSTLCTCSLRLDSNISFKVVVHSCNTRNFANFAQRMPKHWEIGYSKILFVVGVHFERLLLIMVLRF